LFDVAATRTKIEWIITQLEVLESKWANVNLKEEIRPLVEDLLKFLGNKKTKQAMSSLLPAYNKFANSADTKNQFIYLRETYDWLDILHSALDKRSKNITLKLENINQASKAKFQLLELSENLDPIVKKVLNVKNIINVVIGRPQALKPKSLQSILQEKRKAA